MHDLTDFERQIGGVLDRMGGAEPQFDAMAVSRAAATKSPTWRLQSMFSATKLVVAGAIVALFGGFLLAGVLTQPSEAPVPAASIGASCPEAHAFARADGPVTAVRSAGSGYLSEDGYGPEAISDAHGYRRTTWEQEQDVESDDDRLSGRLTGEFTTHGFSDPEGNQPVEYRWAALTVADVLIENEAGSWTGQYRAHDAGVPVVEYSMTLLGDGAYDGCAASLDGHWGGVMAGVIYPSEAVAGAE